VKYVKNLPAYFYGNNTNRLRQISLSVVVTRFLTCLKHVSSSFVKHYHYWRTVCRKG